MITTRHKFWLPGHVIHEGPQIPRTLCENRLQFEAPKFLLDSFKILMFISLKLDKCLSNLFKMLMLHGQSCLLKLFQMSFRPSFCSNFRSFATPSPHFRPVKRSKSSNRNSGKSILFLIIKNVSINLSIIRIKVDYLKTFISKLIS
jgi:hypothetical protein